MLKRLAELANRLDSMGHTDAADEIDSILKEAGIGDWLREKFNPADLLGVKTKCDCTCEKCKIGKENVGATGAGKMHCRNKDEGCEAV